MFDISWLCFSICPQSGHWVDIIDHNIDHLQNLPQITVLTKLLDFFIQLN